MLRNLRFFIKFVRLCESNTLHLLCGGDFNIIRRQEEKNNDNFNPHWPFISNTVIESLNLRELMLPGRQYTWANHRVALTYDKLDIILQSMEREKSFHLHLCVR